MKCRNWALVAPLLIVGCSGGSGGGGYVPTPTAKITPASVKAGEEATLLPFKVGNTWTYSMKVEQQVGARSARQTKDATFRVAKVDQVNGRTQATMELMADGKVMDKQVWYVDSKGIYQVSIGDGPKKNRTFSTPIPAILFPVEIGKKFEWKGTDQKSTMAYNSQIRGVEEVDTDMKRLSAYAIETKGTSVSGKVTENTDRTIWFAPGIGMVRISESTKSSKGASAMLLSLKNYTVK